MIRYYKIILKKKQGDKETIVLENRATHIYLKKGIKSLRLEFRRLKIKHGSSLVILRFSRLQKLKDGGDL